MARPGSLMNSASDGRMVVVTHASYHLGAAGERQRRGMTLLMPVAMAPSSERRDAPRAGVRFLRLKDDEPRARVEGVRGAGHRLDREAVTAPRHVAERVTAVEHRVPMRRVHPHHNTVRRV